LTEPNYDVVVVGGGNAGLCAAMTAKESVGSVLLIEKSPQESRGGNSKYTRDIRCGAEGISESTRYSKEEFTEDLLRVTGRETNLELADLTVEQSFNIPDWMTKHGVKWQSQLRGTLQLNRTNRFFIGGGKALVDTYYSYAKIHNIDVLYNSAVEDIKVEDSSLRSVTINSGGRTSELEANSFVVAAGGFEANIPWLKEYWGESASNFIVRGSKYNTGKVLRLMLDHGAMSSGSPKEAHAVAVDARSPKFDGGIVTRNDSIPFGIAVNKLGKRFYDEGDDLWPKRYAIWGKLIAEQPDQIAYSVIDSKVVNNFLPPMYDAFKSNSIVELAQMIHVDEDSLVETVKRYNDHVARGKKYSPAILDECTTSGIDPPKTHWALPLEDPPFYSYPLSPGITFTYLGLKVDRQARVYMKSGSPFKNVFACGEVMAGNILTRGYLAGFGLTIGTTFGRIAGESASKLA
jgi:tricarballylate dehydrogenase